VKLVELCGHVVAVDCQYKMPPRRRSSRASQKESDERLSIAETIAGLANSIEQPTFSPHVVITRQNSYDDRLAANFARLPSMVVDEVDNSGSLPVSLHSVPLVTRSVSVDGSASTTRRGHVDIPARKIRSQADKMQVHVQSQPSVCSTNDSVFESQSTLQSTSETVTCTETDTASCSVFSAVLMGWNPPVLATCPSSTVESESPGEVSTLSTVEPANHNASVGVVKLPLVLEPISDGTWLLVPMSASAACGSTVLPNTECVPVIQTVTQHNGQSADPLSTSVSQVDVAHSSELVTAVDSGTLPLHSLGSLSVLGSYYNVSDGLSSTVTGIVNGVSCSGHATSESASHSLSSASSSDEAVGQFGSLGALRDYYSRISASVAQSSSLTANKVQILNSAASVASVGNNELNNADALHRKMPAVSVPVCNDHIVQPVLCTVDMSAARNVDTQTKLSLHSASGEAANSSLPVQNSSRVLPAVLLDHHRASCESSSNQLVTESQCSVGGPALLTDEGGCEHSSMKHLSCGELLRHLPPKKRQKVSSDIQSEREQNGFHHRTSNETETEQTADDDQRNVNVDPPDISLSEEIVTLIENPLSTSVAGIPTVTSLHQLC